MPAARTRYLSPGLFQNEQLGALGLGPYMLAAFLPLLADRAGRLEDRPGQIQARLFSFDHDGERPTVAALTDWLSELAGVGYIRRYNVDGRPCIHIVNFAKYQRPHPHERPSELPEPPLHAIACNDMSLHVVAFPSEPSGPSGPSGPSEPSGKSKSSRSTAPANAAPVDPQHVQGAKPAKVNGHGGEPRPSVDAVVALWHELMPDCARVRVLTDARRQTIANRIRNDLPSEKHWRRYFAYIRTVPFLMGKAPPGHGHTRAFRPTLLWFCKPENFAKVSEDFYDA
jgi:hypothetical protein